MGLHNSNRTIQLFRKILDLFKRLFFSAGCWTGGDFDGIYGYFTTAAVRAFQCANYIPTNGIVNKYTLSKIEQWAGTLSNPRSKTPQLAYIHVGTQYATVGDSGAAVNSIRALLNQKGYNCASSGTFDNTLKTVVKKFQTDKGLTSDDIVGQATLAVLENTRSSTGWLSNNRVSLTAGLLAQAGFSQVILTSRYVNKLNSAFNLHGLTERKQVQHILAQIMAETGGGKFLLENGYQAGRNPTYSSASYRPFFGAGFIHLTWFNNYYDFGNYLGDSAGIMNNTLYSSAKVGLIHPDTSTGWFLTVKEDNAEAMKQIHWDNSMTDRKRCEKLTAIIYGMADQSKVNERLQFFNKIKSVIK